MSRIFILDNYDSFTYNLVQYLGELGAEVSVQRNDQCTPQQVLAGSYDGVIVSPGPCTPNEAGISLELVSAAAGNIPVFGVCLGHQTIGQVFGGHVVRAEAIMHGKVSEIHHNGEGMFTGLPNPFEATRYHSLVVERSTFPDVLEVTAWTADDTVMGLRHRHYPIYGVQFHPESILTTSGKTILDNFLKSLV